MIKKMTYEGKDVVVLDEETFDTIMKQREDALNGFKKAGTQIDELISLLKKSGEQTDTVLERVQEREEYIELLSWKIETLLGITNTIN